MKKITIVAIITALSVLANAAPSVTEKDYLKDSRVSITNVACDPLQSVIQMNGETKEGKEIIIVYGIPSCAVYVDGKIVQTNLEGSQGIIKNNK
jgi:hypothetical protein